MIETVQINLNTTLEDYAEVAYLAPLLREMKAEARVLSERLRGRTVWMVNSTAQGGGVAEMLPRVVSMLCELGVETKWAVINSDDMAFFDLTKQLHNLIHDSGSLQLSEGARDTYEATNRRNADAFAPMLKDGDVLAVHDPQPMALAGMLKKQLDLPTIWRCHIGLDRPTDRTGAAWRFLKPYAEAYDEGIFTTADYIPSYFAGRADIIHPAIDPLGHKNRELSPHKLVGVLANSALLSAHHPVVTDAFEHQVARLQDDGEFHAGATGVGLLFRPIVTQVSRWDRLKGWTTLLDGFARMKQRSRDRVPERHQRSLELARLVLAGPDPASIQDDPEGIEVIEEIKAAWRALPDDVRGDVAVLSLPMDSVKENALIVNALQRCSTVVAQNSVQEGFGLTCTEAMWKGIPILASNACGLREQVRPEIDGLVVDDANDADQIAAHLDTMLRDAPMRGRMGRAAQRRVVENFLVFTQVTNWLRALCRVVERHQG
jgi:trehalose synthase